MTKVYIYKLTVDDGGAPCVRDALLSLAICKPAIRSTARSGNVILGFAGNYLYEDNTLVYMATVTQHVDGRKYFNDGPYASRPDCIYTWDGQHFQRKHDSKFHSAASNLAHDLGEPPPYTRANVLLSQGSEFRYFGENCPVRYKQEYPRLKALVEGLGQGHRVNFDAELQGELRRFIKQALGARSLYRETPIPDEPCPDRCSSGDEDYASGEC
jgi:hypothetical protein